ncbi:MAG: hypothetical protein J7M18_08080 [Candidatus Eremiobacteraeota bacterium]|nr:hypothetical protein [Candidatus Eremiobacteraeota bacterium]
MPGISFKFPALSGNLRLARLVSMGFASRKGYDYDQVADIALMVGESCAFMLLHVEEGSELHLSLELKENRAKISVLGTSEKESPEFDPNQERLSLLILRYMADSFIWSKNPPWIKLTFRLYGDQSWKDKIPVGIQDDKSPA